MKMHEIKELTRDEIDLRLQDTTEELYNLRFQHAVHQLDNPLRLSDVKKDIARLKTVLHEFDIGVRATRGEEKKSE